MSAENQMPVGSTSASPTTAGVMLTLVNKPLLVGCIFFGLGTSAGASPNDLEVISSQCIERSTTAGGAINSGESVVAAISELRRISGLTWEQLARLFRVSRRSVHFWASGRPMTAGNEEHLQRVLAAVRKLDRGSASSTRALLFRMAGDGSLPFDLLAAREYDRVVSALSSGAVRDDTASRSSSRTSKLSSEARAARAPRPPEELVDAYQDRIHPTSGRLLFSKPIIRPRRK